MAAFQKGCHIDGGWGEKSKMLNCMWSITSIFSQKGPLNHSKSSTDS